MNEEANHFDIFKSFLGTIFSFSRIPLFFWEEEEYVFGLVVCRGKEVCVCGEDGSMGMEWGFVLLGKGGFSSEGKVFWWVGIFLIVGRTEVGCCEADAQ